MLGLAYIVFFGVYGWLSIKLVRRASQWAKARDRSPLLWGGLVIVLAYSVVFWDLIPTYAAHRYYCGTQGGFAIHRTLEAWQVEHPGVAQTLAPVEDARLVKIDGGVYYPLNQRFNWEILTTKLWYILSRRDERIVDGETGEVLAQYTDFYTDLINPMVRPTTRIRDFKMWMKIGSCEASDLPEKVLFNGYYQTVKGLGGS